MSSATDDIQIVSFFKPVVRASPEHLFEVVSEIEYSSTIDVRCTPVIGCYDAFRNDVIFDIIVSQLSQLFDYEVSVICFDVIPYYGIVSVWNWDQNINGRMPFRSKTVIGNARILNLD